MAALVTLGILILIWTVLLVHYLHYLPTLSHMSDADIRLCGGWLLLVLPFTRNIEVKTGCEVVPAKWEEGAGTVHAGAHWRCFLWSSLLSSRGFLLLFILAWLKRAGNPTGLIRVLMG